MNPIGLLPVLIAILAVAPARAAGSDALGRLFFTPERRLALERQRTHNVQQAQALQGTTMTLDGVVFRSSGKSTVWINQHAQNENDAKRTGVSATLSPRDPGRALIAPGEDTPAKLKVAVNAPALVLFRRAGAVLSARWSWRAPSGSCAHRGPSCRR